MGVAVNSKLGLGVLGLKVGVSSIRVDSSEGLDVGPLVVSDDDGEVGMPVCSSVHGGGVNSYVGSPVGFKVSVGSRTVFAEGSKVGSSVNPVCGPDVRSVGDPCEVGGAESRLCFGVGSNENSD